MNKSIMESIRDFIRRCPYLEEYHNGIGVDYLGEDSTCYSIESTVSEPLLKRYVNGDEKRQMSFVFASREPYGVDVRQNLENIGFFEHFSAWLQECTSKEQLPILADNQLAIAIETTTNGYAFDVAIDKAKYQIDCRLIYMQKGA